jgi:ABC-type microcin C transport system duplicated ATPase subunit YejF
VLTKTKAISRLGEYMLKQPHHLATFHTMSERILVMQHGEIVDALFCSG